MAFRVPDWLIYSVAVAAVIGLARLGDEDIEAPEPPPPVVGAEEVPLPSTLPFDPGAVIRIPQAAPMVGTAFSVSSKGVWLTAGKAARACRRPALVVAEGRGVEARIELADEGGIMTLTTDGGAPPIAITSKVRLRAGDRTFVPGYPLTRPGEATARLIGRAQYDGDAVLAFAESGRTKGLGASLAGLAGAPILNEEGRALGVLIADSPRRGVLYAAEPAALVLAIAKARTQPEIAPMAEPVNAGNYYRVADALRRDLSIVPVRCLSR